ncbi:hypothetical protein ES703_22559 [subsurface metagenome]
MPKSLDTELTGRAKFSYPKEFQARVLSCLYSSTTFFAQVNQFLYPEYFEDEVLAFFCRKIYMCYREYKTAPTEEILSLEIDKAKERKEILPEASSVYTSTLDLILDQDFKQTYIEAQVQDFIKFQVYRDSLSQGIELLKDRDFVGIDEALKVATSLNFDSRPGQKYFAEIDARLVRRSKVQEEEIPTLIPGLDPLIRGGIRKKELAVIEGLPGSGKSIFKINIAKGAVLCGKKVIYYTLEMSGDDIADRFDSTFSGVNMNTLLNRAATVKKKISKLGVKYADSLVIKEYPTKLCTPDTLEAHVNGLIETGFRPDLIIVDYADLLRPNKTYSQRRFELENIYLDLRSMAMELPVAIWTASQANRRATEAELIGMEFVSEAFSKIMIADIVISINQSKAEEEEGEMRLHLVKNRYAKKGKIIKIKNAFQRMQFAMHP